MAAKTAPRLLDATFGVPDPPPPSLTLLQTKTFRTSSKGSIQPHPSVVHFGGFEVGKTHSLVLRLLNAGSERSRVNIIPPTSEFFKATYIKREMLLPGTSEEILIHFTPTEYRYYYDCIRVHCQNDDNLLIPIHAYPVIGDVSVPSIIDMGSTPLSETRIKKIPITCTVPIDFEYSVNIVEANPFFKIVPESGIIPAKGTAEIIVAFTPQNYTTSTFVFELLLSQFNSKPLRCTVTGSSTPGLVKAAHIQQLTASTTAATTTTDSQSPPVTTKKSKAVRASTTTTTTTTKAVVVPATEEMQVIDGVKIPTKITSMHQVNQILNQGPVGGLNATVVLNDGCQGREARVIEFNNALKTASRVVGRGTPEVTHEQRRAILAARRLDDQVYKTAQGTAPSSLAQAIARRVSVLDTETRRTHRNIDTPIDQSKPVTFVVDAGLEWRRRSQALAMFVSAARKIIIRNRATRRCAGLMSTIQSGQTGRKPSTRLISVLGRHVDAPSTDDKLHAKRSMIAPLSFPVTELPALIQITTPRTVVPVASPSVTLTRPALVKLEIPPEASILGYNPINYIDAALAFRKSDFDYTPSPAKQQTVHDSDEKQGSSVVQQVLELSLPSAEVDVHHAPGDIFTPLPNTRIHSEPLPFSEVDADRMLCPWNLPSSLQPKRSSVDAVPELLLSPSSQCASALVLPTMPSVSHVWIPRLSTLPVSDGLMATAPSQITSLIEELEGEAQTFDPTSFSLDAALASFPPLPDPIQSSSSSNIVVGARSFLLDQTSSLGVGSATTNSNTTLETTMTRRVSAVTSKIKSSSIKSQVEQKINTDSSPL